MTDYAAIFRDSTIPPSVVEAAMGALRDIAAGDSDLLAVRHPLGFLCFPIERHGTCGICVHMWSPTFPQARLTTSEVHTHSWDLLSRILYGELHNVRMTVLDDEPTHRVFEVRSDAGGDRLLRTSRLVRYQKVADDVYGPGDSYSMRAGSFHASVASVATTVAIGMARPGKADLSLGAIDGRTHFVFRERCDRQATARAARLVAEQLSEAAIR